MSNTAPDSEPAQPHSSVSEAAGRPRVYQSAELFGAGKEVWIEHGEELYRLRITAQGKLLLTK